MLAQVAVTNSDRPSWAASNAAEPKARRRAGYTLQHIEMTLVEAVRIVRQPVLEGIEPDRELLLGFAQMVELHHRESPPAAPGEGNSRMWAQWLIAKAKEQGWIDLCVARKLLPPAWLKWPHHNNTSLPKLNAVKAASRSLRGTRGGVIKQNRRKH